MRAKLEITRNKSDLPRNWLSEIRGG